VRAVGRRPLERLRPQLGRIGIKPEDDLRLARRDELREPVGEGRRAVLGG